MDQPPTSATWLWGEVAVGFALVQAALWTEGAARSVLTFAAATAIAVAVSLERPSLGDVGLARAGLGRSAWVVAATAGLAGILLLAGWLAGSSRYPFQSPVLVLFAAYLPWSLAQQFAAQSFFYRRLEALLGSRKAVGVAALLFSAAHLPNPVLARRPSPLGFCSPSSFGAIETSTLSPSPTLFSRSRSRWRYRTTFIGTCTSGSDTCTIDRVALRALRYLRISNKPKLILSPSAKFPGGPERTDVEHKAR